MTNEMLVKIAEWRQKAQDKTLTTEDMKAAITAIRGDRKTAASVSEQARRTRAKKEVKSADELLKDLGV